MRSIAFFLIFMFLPVKAHVDFGEQVSFYKLINSPEAFNDKKIFISGVVAAVEYHSGGGPLLRKIFLFPNSDSASHFVLREAVEIEYANEDLFNYVQKSLNMHMIEVVGDYTFNKSDRNLGSINNFSRFSLMGKNRFKQDKVGDESQPTKQDKLW
ncbi:hypothetical protein [Rheinheimera hassiensis]|uniref:hypothetical protein n=1 Tax=Rheinheimera hassiensis TaxID=1193627 RepID=UPI001F05E90E|nr:hypothetical protein [Rheinheimera hassiensis]